MTKYAVPLVPWYRERSLVMQDKPTKEEVFKQKQVTKEKDTIHGVRLGAGDRSYLIRNNRIDVLRNQYGGVEVRFSDTMRTWHAACNPIP